MNRPVVWSPQASDEYRRQVQWLEENRDARTVLQYLHEVATAIDRVAAPTVRYQAVASHPGIYRYKLNAFTHLYYRLRNETVELIAFFDTRQNPDRLKL